MKEDEDKKTREHKKIQDKMAKQLKNKFKPLSANNDKNE